MRKERLKIDRNTIRRLIYIAAPIFSALIFILAWFILSYYKSKIVASPLSVVEKFIELCTRELSDAYIWGHIWASLRRILIGLGLAIVIGIPIGILIGWNRFFRGTVGALFEMIRPIPALAWIPLFVVWMGIGETPRIVMVFTGAIMPIVVNSYTGVRMTSPNYLQVGKMFNATTGFKLLKNIVIPSALPAIFAGIRTAVSVSWTVVLAAEMIAAPLGLGFIILRGMDVFDVPLIMLGMLLIALLGALLSVIASYVERKICSWNTSLKHVD